MTRKLLTVEAPNVVAAYSLRLRLGTGAEVETHALDDTFEVLIPVRSEKLIPDLLEEIQAWMREESLESVTVHFGDRTEILPAE